jgi:hypothetical protein
MLPWIGPNFLDNVLKLTREECTISVRDLQNYVLNRNLIYEEYCDRSAESIKL